MVTAADIPVLNPPDALLPYVWAVVYDWHEVIGGKQYMDPKALGAYRFTRVSSIHTSREAADTALAKQHESPNVSLFTPCVNYRIVEPTEPAPVFLSVDAAKRVAKTTPVTLYTAQCPVCGLDYADWGSDEYSCADLDMVMDSLRDHLSWDHNLPYADQHDNEEDPEQ